VLRQGIEKAAEAPCSLFFKAHISFDTCIRQCFCAIGTHVGDAFWVVNAHRANVLESRVTSSQSACKGFTTHIVAINFHVAVQERREKRLEAFASKASALDIAVQDQL
jgi:hypothetical protein